MTSTAEEELEKFRRKWKEEVSKNQVRAKQQTGSQAGPSSSRQSDPLAQKRAQVPSSNEIIPQDHDGGHYETRNPYHELEGRVHERRAGDLEAGESSKNKEPQGALEHYEKAVERENQGALGESLGLYRKAFRLDDRVHEQYKQKHFPASSFLPKPVPQPGQKQNTTSASVTVPNTAQHSLAGLSAPISQLLNDFASLRIAGEVPPTEADPAPPCPIADLPEELLVEILLWVAISDVANFVRLSLVCKRLAYLAASEDRIWKRVVEGPEFGFDAMRYRYTVSVEGEPHTPPLSPSSSLDDLIPLPTLPLTAEYPSYRQSFRSRPRVRFNGAYISTVNYTRPGAASTNSLTWGSPVLIVTYYRYLRFFRDGSCVSLLTTAEPADVVPYLQKEYMPTLGRKERAESALPGAVMRDALRGRWRLSRSPYCEKTELLDSILPADEVAEAEGDLHIETEGVTPKYLYKMQLTIGSAGRTSKNNKFDWKGYWSYNKLTDDWAEFGLKHYRAFWFSRVKSYGTGMNAGV